MRKLARSTTIVLIVALILATIAVAQGGKIYLPVVFGGESKAQPQQYPVDGWVITNIWVFQGITYFTLVNNGWTVDAMCIEPNVTPPPVGSVCSLNGDIFTCPGWQGSKLIKIINVTNPAALDWIMTTSQSQAKLEQHVAQAFLSGDSEPWFTLPAGPVGFAAGVEWRKEKSSSDPQTLPWVNRFQGKNATRFDSDQQNWDLN